METTSSVQLPVVWTVDFSVGDDEMDRQHRRWFEILSDLTWALKTGAAAHASARALQAALSYTRRHFAEEEALMTRVGFPGIEAHVLAHRQFVAVLELRASQAMELGSGLELSSLLHGWLGRHIKVVDRKYAAYLEGPVASGHRKSG